MRIDKDTYTFKEKYIPTYTALLHTNVSLKAYCQVNLQTCKLSLSVSTRSNDNERTRNMFVLVNKKYETHPGRLLTSCIFLPAVQQ